MKKFFKGFFKFLLIFILMAACFIGGILLGGYSKEYKDHDEARRDGYREGYDDGYKDGYKDAEYDHSKSSASTETTKPTKTPIEKPTESPTPIPDKEATAQDDTNIKVKAGSKTYTVRQSVKDELDAYEAYWDDYVEALKSAKKNDAISYLTKYTEMMQTIGEISEHSSERDDLTKDEDSYYAYRLMDIYQKMLTAIQSLI